VWGEKRRLFSVFEILEENEVYEDSATRPTRSRLESWSRT
jgi:hypothetical protein